MALELRPVCEHCNVALPPSSPDARICSFECTFCRACADDLLGNVCPNCGGGFCPRPIRPATNWKGDNFIGAYPPGAIPKHRPVDLTAHEAFARPIRLVPADQR
jgi:hypothetical protein